MNIPLEFLLLLLITLQAGVGGQMIITAVTDVTLTGDAEAHSFSDNDKQIATSLLGSDTPAVLRGLVSSADVNKVCTQLSKTGNLGFNATLATSEGGNFVIIEVLEAYNIQRCLRAGDSSGTQLVLLGKDGQQSVLLCPDNADYTSCGVYSVKRERNCCCGCCCYNWCCDR
jgi:hypothetical protein